MGGKVQGMKNADNGHLKKISLLPRSYHPRHWYNNGEISILIKEGDTVPENFKLGRLCQQKKS